MDNAAVRIPPVEAVLGETVASLVFAAHAYLQPADPNVAPDLDAAEIAIDVAGMAFDRIAPRLPSDQRSAFSGMLTDLRMTFVQKRG